MARRIAPRRIVAVALAAAAALGLAALLLAWSGLYNIAASRGHWKVVEWFLAFGMSNSVELRARSIEAPALDSADLVTLGAAHFHSGCAYCHGAPGIPINPIAQQMLPSPPELSEAAGRWVDAELFWIVKHGIKYTGMPAWVSQQRDDEVWAVVAFLKRLPALDADGYHDLALGGLAVEPQTGRELATTEAADEAVSACARCHGAEGRRPASRLVPVLHGQPRDFLLAALTAYADGRRASGIMQPVAAGLTPQAMQKIAAYYAALAPPAPERADAPAIERGAKLAIEGVAQARIPSCASCHGADALTAYPRLAGENAAYMAGRLRLWRSGLANGTATDAIMAPIARLLSEQQIDEVSAYFAGQRRGARP